MRVFFVPEVPPATGRAVAEAVGRGFTKKIPARLTSQ
jgi:hypothetical protein